MSDSETEQSPPTNARGTEPSPRRMPLLPWLIAFIAMAFILAIVMPPQKIEKAYNGNGRSPVTRTMNDLRSIATALEAYFVDFDSYPPCTKGNQGVNSFLLKKDAPERTIWTFHAPAIGKDGKMDDATLTTPVAYMSNMPHDVFANYEGCAFGYYNANNLGWIMWSPGPDRIYDVDPLKDYDPNQSNPMPRLFLKSYDPTNGTYSSGDIWRVKG